MAAQPGATSIWVSRRPDPFTTSIAVMPIIVSSSATGPQTVQTIGAHDGRRRHLAADQQLSNRWLQAAFTIRSQASVGFRGSNGAALFGGWRRDVGTLMSCSRARSSTGWIFGNMQVGLADRETGFDHRRRTRHFQNHRRE